MDLIDIPCLNASFYVQLLIFRNNQNEILTWCDHAVLRVHRQLQSMAADGHVILRRAISSLTELSFSVFSIFDVDYPQDLVDVFR